MRFFVQCVNRLWALGSGSGKSKALTRGPFVFVDRNGRSHLRRSCYLLILVRRHVGLSRVIQILIAGRLAEGALILTICTH